MRIFTLSVPFAGTRTILTIFLVQIALKQIEFMIKCRHITELIHPLSFARRRTV